jgi:anti-sigma B factor antagonist
MALDITISSVEGISIFSFKGKFMTDTDGEQVTRALSESKLTENPTHIIFDFGQLSHINSSGINYIIRTLTRTRVNNRDLLLTSVTGNVKKIFEIAKIDEIFTIYDSVSNAINHFKK